MNDGCSSPSMMAPSLPAPLCDLCDQLQRHRLAVRKLDRTFACLVSGQPVNKVCDGLISRIQSYVLAEGCKMYYVSFAPVSRHTPGYPFLCIRQCSAEGIPYLMQDRLYTLWLQSDIIIDRFWRISAEMALLPVIEPAQTLIALPHYLSHSFIATVTLSPGFFTNYAGIFCPACFSSIPIKAAAGAALRRLRYTAAETAGAVPGQAHDHTEAVRDAFEP